jgi:hypothetical protein
MTNDADGSQRTTCGPVRGGAFERIALLFVLLLAAGLDFVALDHGDPGLIDRNGDALHPVNTLGMAQRYHDYFALAELKYPPLVFRIVGAAQRAYLRIAGGEGAVERYERALLARSRAIAELRADPLEWDSVAAETGRLIVVGRGVIAAFGMLLVLAVFLLGRELFGVHAGLIAGALAAANATVVHYAHQLNVDVPYLALAILALAALAGALRRGSERRLGGAIFLAAAAAAAKDQAAGLFLLAVPLALGFFVFPAGGPRRRVPWRGTLAGVAMGAALWLLLPGVEHTIEWHRQHFALIFGEGSQPFRVVSRDLAGLIDLGESTALLIADGMRIPLLVIAIAGIAYATFHAPRRAAILAAPAISYFATFVLPIGYVYARFTLPFQIVLIVFAAALLARLAVGTGRAKRLRLAAFAILFGVAFVTNLHSSVELLRLLRSEDTRAQAERFLRERYSPSQSITSLCSMSGIDLQPPPWPRVHQTILCAGVEREIEPPDVLALSWFLGDVRRDLVTELPPAGETKVLKGSSYRLVARFEPASRHPILLGALLHPVIVIYERDEALESH